MRFSRRAVLTAAVAGLIPLGLVLAPSAPAVTPTFGTGTPGFVVSQAPSSLIGYDNAGEPSIGVHPTTHMGLFMAGTSTYKLDLTTFAATGNPGWTDLSSPFSLSNLDPILATDPVTGVTLAGGDDGPCAVMSKTADDGATWAPSIPCALASDHPTVGFGPFASPKPLGASGDRIAYFCQQQDASNCATSVDGGSTFLPGVPMIGCAGVFGHVKVGPDGTAYIPSKNCVGADNNIGVGGYVSTDNGANWTAYDIPGAPTPTTGFDPSVGITPDNTVYESFARANDWHPVVTSSTTKGASWTPAVDLAGTVNPPIVASTFQSVVAGDNGRVAVAFLGTTVGDTAHHSPFTSGYHGIWNLYVSTSYDGGKTFTTTKVTSTPVQRGEIDGGGTTTLGQRNLLDFMDASLTADGRVVVAYADGCNGSCDTAPDTAASESLSASDQWASAAIQSTGRGLIAAFSP